MPSVTELQEQLQRETGGTVLSPLPSDPGAMSPVARLGWLKNALTELGLPYDFLSAAEGLAARAADMRRTAVIAQSQAAGRRGAVVSKLAADPEAQLADAVRIWGEQRDWLDLEPNQARPRALQICEDAARMVEGNIVGHLMGHAPKLWALARKRAAECVAEIESLPPLPGQIWQVSGDIAAELAKYPAHRSSYGILASAHRDFWLAFSVADTSRDATGNSYSHFPPGAPRASLWIKGWREQMDDLVYQNLRPVMRLAYAVAKGWKPGIWEAGEISTTAAEKTFGGRLQNTGVSVGVNI